ncbi:MAG: hypothetical protein V1882_12080 [Candidatus Omnitrophota bacterium]
MITIKRPVVTVQNGRARLLADIVVENNVRTVWFEVEERFGPYLCYERSDGFLIGLLSWAMREKHDIACEAPVSEELLYQIRTYLIPSVVKGSHVLYASKIIAEANPEKIQNAGAVGAGISCGIDSLHVVVRQTRSPYENLNLTHLAFTNMGSHHIMPHLAPHPVPDPKDFFLEHRKRIERFCQEAGYNLVVSDSNFADIFPQRHLFRNTYAQCFAVYALQKLWRTYFYASCHTFLEFSLEENENKDTSYYDLLLLDTFSTTTLKIYSEGAALTRLEKTREIVEYAPSYRYLNVCYKSSKNCGRCEKCSRTLLSLDLLGCLEKYREVFDVDDYRLRKKEHLVRLLIEANNNNLQYVEMLPFFKKDIGFGVRLRFVIFFLKMKFISWTWLVQLYRFLVAPYRHFREYKSGR